MDTFIQNWPRGKSLITFGFGLLFALVALDIRFWGFLDGIDIKHGGGFLFWIFLIAGLAAVTGSLAGLIRPPLVLSADPTGITFGSSPHTTAREVHVSWNDIRKIECGKYTFQSSRNEHKRNIVALRIECDDSIDLTGCGDKSLFAVGTEAEINDHTNWRRDSHKPIQMDDMREPRNVVLIDSSFFDIPVRSVMDQLVAFRQSNHHDEQSTESDNGPT